MVLKNKLCGQSHKSVGAEESGRNLYSIEGYMKKEGCPNCTHSASGLILPHIFYHFTHP